MKKYLSMLLAVCMVVSLLSAATFANAASSDSIEEQSVRAMGIIVGDEYGNMNLHASVSRAEFAKMMVAASNYKNTVGASSGYSLFKDVKSDHWAVEYIKLAVSQGWFLGYLDGSFRPDGTITIEECATALLRLLGYTSSDIVGTYPTAQLSKFEALDLGKNIARAQGQTVTRRDCVTIFYNLMTAKNKSNTLYGSTLGYKINAAGELDYSSIVNSDLKGPFVLGIGESVSSMLPFNSTNVTVYKNGDSSSLSAVTAFDVYYYNASLRTVWVYDRRVIGTYSAASPSTTAPASVTVAGMNYTIGASAAAYKLSSLGPFSIGSNVALLLGMDGSVVDVITASDMNSSYYGVIISTQTSSYTEVDGSAISKKTVSVACTDGIVRQYPGSGTAGTPVSVNCIAGKTTVSNLGTMNLSGTVNAAATELGSFGLADNIEILDADSNGNYAKIFPSRLAGTFISSANVRYYTLNNSGKINRLILNNATGDIFKYGYVISSSEIDSGINVSGSYSYVIGGTVGSLRTPSSKYAVNEGGAVFYYKNGAISSIKNIECLALSSLNEQYAVSGDKQYSLADNIQIYEEISGNYYLVSNNAVSDTSKYNLKGYCDNFGCSAGGKVRIIIAKEKTATDD